MTVRTALSRVVQQEDINFLLTNRIPRRLATLFVGWLSKIENPLVSVPAIALWRLFCDVDLPRCPAPAPLPAASMSASPGSSRRTVRGRWTRILQRW